MSPFKINSIFLLIILLGALACSPPKKVGENARTGFDMPPAWAQEAIWYQIFIERFRNGDISNDPDLTTTFGATDEPFPQDWSITDWGHNWYAQEDWAQKTGRDFYSTIQQRRYGGDLQGVLDKLDHLQELGITAVYFNPLNDAPSLHKYDARNYHHIDVSIGPDPKGDMKIMDNENPADTATWQWTSADTFFVHVVKELHKKDIRVILDFSWNHTGRQFWAWKDVVQNQQNSPYANWYDINRFDDPATPENEFDYDGWVGIKALPEWKKVGVGSKIENGPFDGNLYPDVKEHIFAVTKRWMDPNGDGDFSDGIDGMRLDVADKLPAGFWKEFRQFTRSINPDFYLIGEVWWKNWPDTLMDPKPWVKGDIFDAVMHYQWYKPSRGYFIGGADSLSKQAWQDSMTRIFTAYRPETARAMMNLAGSHDSPRMATSLKNKNKYKYHCKPPEDPYYRTDYPLDDVWALIKLFQVHQFTFVGSPHIFNGDELGMWGADDPDNRKPVWWKDNPYEVETQSSYSDFNYLVKPRIRKDVLRQYKALGKLRREHPALSSAHFEFLESGQERVVMYERTNEKESLLVVLNVQAAPATIELPKNFKSAALVFGEEWTGTLQPFSAAVFVKQ